MISTDFKENASSRSAVVVVAVVAAAADDVLSVVVVVALEVDGDSFLSFFLTNLLFKTTNCCTAKVFLCVKWQNYLLKNIKSSTSKSSN